MIYQSLNSRTRYIIKLQQHLVFHEQVVGDAVAYLYDGFKIFVLVALFETGTQGFYPGFFDFDFGFVGFGFVGFKLLVQAFNPYSF